MPTLKRYTGTTWETIAIPSVGFPATLGYAQVVADQTGITGEVDLAGLSVTVTVPEGRRIKITGVALLDTTVADTMCRVHIKEGATSLQLAQTAPNLANNADVVVAQVILTPGAGAHTYKLTALRATGTGTVNMRAAATFPAFILVEDVTGGSSGGGSSTASPDNPPATANSKDDEFNDSSLDAKWSWVNQGATTYSEANGWGTLTVPAAGTSSLRCLVQSAPTGAFTMTAKLSCVTSGSGAGGVYAIIMRDSVSGKILSVGCNMGTSNNPINVYQWNSATSWNGQAASVVGEQWRGGVLYFRFRRNSNTSYDTWFSRDGAGWFPISTAWNPSAFVASIDQIGFFGDSENSAVNIMSIDWFRVTEP